MADWREIAVAELAAKSPNALATGPFGSAISSKFFEPSGVPVIRGSNLSDALDPRLIDDNFVFVSPAKASEFGRSVVRRGDLVFTCWGTVGQVGLIDERARYDEYVVSNKQMKLTPNPQVADSLFLYYVFSTPPVSEAIKSQAIGSSVPGFNLSQLRSVRLRLPSIAEQRAIVGVLGALDDKIEQNRQTARALEQLARAIFRAWFVDFEPVKAKVAGATTFPSMPQPVFGALPTRFVDSTIGPVPEGWMPVAVSSTFEVNPVRSLRKDAPAPYLDMKNMPTKGHAPDSWSVRSVGSGMRFMNGDTLVARITPCLENGKTAFVDFLDNGQIAWGSTEYIVLRPKSPLPPVFAYCLARTDEFRDFATQNMTGTSGRQRVSKIAMDHFLIAMPSEAAAAGFGEIVQPLFRCIGAGMDESRKLAAMRDYLLPKLLSGDVRVEAAHG